MRNKHVRFCDSFSVKFPPSKKFEEPANMVNIDLKSRDVKHIVDSTPQNKNKFELRKVWKKLLYTVLGFTFIGLTTLTLPQIFSKVSTSELTEVLADGERTGNPSYSADELREIIDTYWDKLQTCKRTREYGDCCITAGKMGTKLIIEDCSADKVLEIMQNYDNTIRLQHPPPIRDINYNVLTDTAQLTKLLSKRELLDFTPQLPINTNEINTITDDYNEAKVKFLIPKNVESRVKVKRKLPLRRVDKLEDGVNNLNEGDLSPKTHEEEEKRIKAQKFKWGNNFFDYMRGKYLEEKKLTTSDPTPSTEERADILDSFPQRTKISGEKHFKDFEAANKETKTNIQRETSWKRLPDDEEQALKETYKNVFYEISTKSSIEIIKTSNEDKFVSSTNIRNTTFRVDGTNGLLELEKTEVDVKDVDAPQEKTNSDSSDDEESNDSMSQSQSSSSENLQRKYGRVSLMPDKTNLFEAWSNIEDLRLGVKETNANLSLENTKGVLGKSSQIYTDGKIQGGNKPQIEEDEGFLSSGRVATDKVDFNLKNASPNFDENVHSRMNPNYVLVPGSNSNFEVQHANNVEGSPSSKASYDEATKQRISGSDFQNKAKTQQFATVNEVVQSNQQAAIVPSLQAQCVPYTAQLAPSYPIIQQQIPVGYGVPKYAPLMPYSFPGIPRPNYYMTQPQYHFASPYLQPYTNPYISSVPNQTPPLYGGHYQSEHVLSNTNPMIPIQASGPDGKFYLCNPVPDPSNNVVNIPGVEIRHSPTLREAVGSSSLQEALDDPDPNEIVGNPLNLENLSNKSRAANHCPTGERMCSDDSKCIKHYQICDGDTDCEDGSDEAFCSCKLRVGEARWCDGYYDCPFGEDEIGCFGCDESSLNCDDWTEENRLASCVPMEERCDGISQCSTGKDEEDCVMLAKELGKAKSMFQVSNNVGFLHRNYKGKWYPACSNAEYWAKEACDVESGPSDLPPLTHLIPVKVKYVGLYVNALDNSRVELTEECVHGRAVYVECPQPTCGMRKIRRNPYRSEEVDTSVEKILSRYSHQGDETKARSVLNDSFIVGSESRVVGGKPSQPGAWPWIVSIYRNGIFHCGGAIVSPSWVITAAHCVDKYWQFYYEIEAGILRRFSYCPMQQNRYASYVVAQPDYDRANLKNDLALIKLSASLAYNRYVRPICMPSEITAGHHFLRNPAPGTICTAVGWGATVEHGYDPDHLREVEVPVLSHCKHKEDQLGDGICAGLIEGGKDACQGDSGGPFLCRNPNFPAQWYLAGITSHGEGCARPNEPGVYTRVSKYNDWVYNNARDDRLPKRQPLQKCPGYVCNLTGKCLPKKRRCDKIVDCLAGDDEQNCDHSFASLFKHALENMYLVGRSQQQGEFPSDTTNSSASITIDKMTLEVATSTDSIFDAAFKMESSSSGDSANRNGFGFIEDGTSFASPTRISDGNRYISNETVDGLASATKDQDLTTENYEVDESPAEFVLATAPEISDDHDSTTNSNTMATAAKPLLETPTFLCKKLMQVVLLSRRCDKVVDCEDGTDEENCTCADYLKTFANQTICDGFTDCYDLSDEKNCGNCSSLEYYCPKSKMCIPLPKRCDGSSDCEYQEDERDCFGLSNGRTIEVDEDLRPLITLSGIVAFNSNGTWRPLCANWSQQEPSFAGDICLSMGFSEYKKFFQLTVYDKQLEVKIKGKGDDNVTAEGPNTASTVGKCSALYVECSNKSFDLAQETTQERKFNAVNELYPAPWNARIYANGEYKCTGIILNFRWILTTINCFPDVLRLYHSYVCVLLGSFRGYLNVGGPHEQVIRVVESVKVAESGIVLLRIEKDFEVTRYVRPMQLRLRETPARKKELCYAMGIGADHKLTNIYLKSIKRNCTTGFKCLKRIYDYKEYCDTQHEKLPWSGTIFCDHGDGIYPAALYSEPLGECGFKRTAAYVSMSVWVKSVLESMVRERNVIITPKCPTFRCNIGLCLKATQVCDGIADCPDGMDEDPEFCNKKRRECHLVQNCECSKGEFKCGNGKCLPKAAFCNSVKECDDGYDEPSDCSCRSYLLLTNKEKICDGEINCHDSADETNCPCSDDKFSCSKNKTCIAKQMVCDGYDDCPDKEDEENCISLVSMEGRLNAGEVLSQSSGIWHRGCFKEHLTKPELEEICRRLGVNSGSARYLQEPSKDTNITAKTPIFGTFTVVRFPGKGLNLALRSGRDPYLSFQGDPNCHRLFIEC